MHGQGLEQRLAQRRAAGLLDGHRRELHPEQALPRGREGHASRAQVGGRRARRRRASRSRTSTRRARSSSRSTRATRARSSTTRGALADALLGPHHTARQAGRRAGRPVPRALPGQGHAGPDDRRPGRATSSGSTRCRRTIDATNFQVQQYDGQPVLTWWQGRILEVGFGQGENVIYDSSYRQIATRPGGQRLSRRPARDPAEAGRHGVDRRVRPDPHEPLLAARARRTASSPTRVVQQIDVKTGLVMWEWHALGHVPLTRIATTRAEERLSVGLHPHQLGRPRQLGRRAALRAQHMDAVRRRPPQRRDPLAARRHAQQLQRLGSGTRFYWQHDAEWQPGGLISLFDNGSTPPKEKQSRGLLLEPNLSNHTVTLRKASPTRRRRCSASSQGNTLALPGGNWLMGYGGLPNFTEYDASGHVLLDGYARQERAGLQDLSLAVERAPEDATVGLGEEERRRARRRGQLERRHRRRVLARAGGFLARRAGGGRDGAPRAGSKRRSRRPPPGRTCRCRGSTHRATCSAPRRPSKPDSRPAADLVLVAALLVLGPAGRISRSAVTTASAEIGANAAAAAAGRPAPTRRPARLLRAERARPLGAAGRRSDGLAAARQPRRLGRDPGQLPRRPRRRALSGVSVRGSRSGSHPAGSRRTRRGTGPASCRRTRSSPASASPSTRP